MRDAHKNFAYSTVATAPSPAASGTSLVVAAGDGVKFPTPPFNLTVWPVGSLPLVSNAEILRCTALSTDTLTIARAQEGSSARTVVVGDQIAATITAKTLTDAEDLIYDGDFAAGPTYMDGEIVVYNGVAYLCTKPTTAAPSAWPGGPTALQQVTAKPNYGTSLPAAPVDGQEAILVDSLTNPSYQWRFRYNAGSSSAYKWEFIGGAPLSAYWGVSAVYSAPDNNMNPVPAAGTRITLPRAGDYFVETKLSGQDGGAANSTDIYMNTAYVGGATLVSPYDGWGRITSQYGKVALSAMHRLTLNAGAIEVRGQMTAGAAGAFGFYYAAISATPVRVS